MAQGSGGSGGGSGPPPTGAVTLAAIPPTIPDGVTYHISGTVTGIPDGTQLTVLVLNTWFDPVTQTPGQLGGPIKVEVVGGAIVAPPFTFSGPGHFDIRIKRGLTTLAMDGGAVSDPVAP